jgi:hypothetical protein
MPAKPTAAPRRSGIDAAIDAAILVGIAALILVGFATSYRTLRDLAETVGGYPPWLAPAVPLSFDLGIVVLSLKVTRAAREGRTAPVMRLLVGALSTATVVVNASAATTPTARLLHAVPPAMFVICFESVIVTSRRHALTDRGLISPPLPRLRTIRWWLAPMSTWRVWRALVLEPLEPFQADPTVLSPALSQSPQRPHPVTAGHQASGIVRSERSDGGKAAQITKGRDKIVADLLHANPKLSAPRLADALSERGHVVSIRTAQRARAAALRHPPSVGEQSRLTAV